MRRAILVDDEYIVVQGLQTAVNWGSYGIRVAGTASNGLEGLELFRRLKPDIVFTDIRMPAIDGLEMVGRILHEAPETICVVFSGFNEFEYVRNAMKLGVVDYIEKPVTIGKIEEAAGKIARHVERQADLLEKATLDLLTKGPESEPKWRECLGGDAKRLAGVSVAALSSDCEPMEEDPSYRIIPVRLGGEYVNVILHWQSPDEAFMEKLRQWDRKAVGTAAGTGQIRREPAELQTSLQEARQALHFAETHKRKGWTAYEDLEKDGEGCSGADAGQKVGNQTVERALHYIAKQYNRDISLQEVARYLGVNATYLSLIFKETVGVPYIKYVTQLRVERAKKLLQEGYSIHEVSGKVGYYYHRHFTDVFKKHTGMTPGQFRESSRADHSAGA